MGVCPLPVGFLDFLLTKPSWSTFFGMVLLGVEDRVRLLISQDQGVT